MRTVRLKWDARAYTVMIRRLGAVLAGSEALKAAVAGQSGVMVGFIRDEEAEKIDGVYRMHTEMIPIKEVMMYERTIPESYLNERGNDVTEEFIRWCRPLIGPELRDFIDFNVTS